MERLPGGFPLAARVTGDMDSIPWLGRSPGEGNDNPIQYSCLGNPMDRGATASQRVGRNFEKQQQDICQFTDQ